MPQDTYITRLCDALSDVLLQAATGTKDRLAGYAANFEFWVEEAEHCLRLIKETETRFSRFEEAQKNTAATDTKIWAERRGYTPPPMEIERSMSWNDRKEARRKIVGAMAKFLNRCAKEGLITEAQRSSTTSKIT